MCNISTVGTRPAPPILKERVNIMLKFITHGKAQPQERPGVNARGKIVKFFDRPNTAEYKHRIQAAAFEALHGRWPRWSGPINLAVVEYREIPISWSFKKRNAALTGTLRPISRPDIKNIIWLCEDSLNKLVFIDDSQIVSYDGTAKYYGELPRLEITVTRL